MNKNVRGDTFVYVVGVGGYIIYLYRKLYICEWV